MKGHITLPSASIPVSREVDVLVIGGGASGIAAAIAAAKGGENNAGGAARVPWRHGHGCARSGFLSLYG